MILESHDGLCSPSSDPRFLISSNGFVCCVEMGFFDWLRGDIRPKVDAYDPYGPVVIVTEGSVPHIAQALRADRRTVSVIAPGHPELTSELVQRKPAVVVIHVESSATQGFTVCNTLKRDTRLRGVPTILFSSDVDSTVFDQHQRLRTRAEAYVTSDAANAIQRAVNEIAPRLSG